MRAERLLPWLLGGAIGAAGILQGVHRQAVDLPVRAEGDPASRITELEGEVTRLKRENAALRSPSSPTSGEIAAPPELAGFVQKALGLDFKESPRIHRLPAEELRNRIAAAIEERYGPDGLDSRQQAWTLMGFLGPQDRFEGQLAAMKSIGTRSWFDPAADEAWVTDHYDPQSVPDQAATIRALAQILIHQHYPPPPGWPGDEAFLAREALEEGAARTVEKQFLSKEALRSGFTGTAPGTDDLELIAHLPPFVKGQAIFAQTLGAPLASRLMDQKKLAAALSQPPSITADYFPGHEGMTAHPPALKGTPGSVLLEESAGMLGLGLWLGEDRTGLTDAWAGDRYRLYAIDDNTVNLIWEIRFATERKADEFLQTAGIWIKAKSEAAAAEGRKLKLERTAPDTVRLVNEVE